jgi:hypothetical protein
MYEYQLEVDGTDRVKNVQLMQCLSWVLIMMNVIKFRKLVFRIFGGDYGSPAENQFENELGKNTTYLYFPTNRRTA